MKFILVFLVLGITVLGIVLGHAHTHGHAHDHAHSHDGPKILKDQHHHINNTSMAMTNVYDHDKADFHLRDYSFPLKHTNLYRVLNCKNIFHLK
jgi:hypothetical protein